MDENPYKSPETEESRNRWPRHLTIRHLTIRHLLLSTLLIGAGLAGYPFLFQQELTIPTALGVVMAFGSPALVGAGIGGPLTGRWGWSALVGIVIHVVAAWTFALFSGLL